VKVKMLVDVTGTRGDGQPWPARGEEVDVPDDEGADLIKSGIAEGVAEKRDAKVEKATAPKAETR